MYKKRVNRHYKAQANPLDSGVGVGFEELEDGVGEGALRVIATFLRDLFVPIAFKRVARSSKSFRCV